MIRNSISAITAFALFLVVAVPAIASAAPQNLIRPVDQAVSSAAQPKGSVDITSTAPRAVRLGDVTVVSLQDKVIKLRFTMIGVPPSAAPTSGPRGQALVTIGVNLVVLKP